MMDLTLLKGLMNTRSLCCYVKCLSKDGGHFFTQQIIVMKYAISLLLFLASFFLLAIIATIGHIFSTFIDISDSPDASPSFRNTCEVKNKIVNLNCVKIGSYNINTYKKQ